MVGEEHASEPGRAIAGLALPIVTATGRLTGLAVVMTLKGSRSSHSERTADPRLVNPVQTRRRIVAASPAAGRTMSERTSNPRHPSSVRVLHSRTAPRHLATTSPLLRPHETRPTRGHATLRGDSSRNQELQESKTQPGAPHRAPMAPRGRLRGNDGSKFSDTCERPIAIRPAARSVTRHAAPEPIRARFDERDRASSVLLP